MQAWDEYWATLIAETKLQSKVDELNEYDSQTPSVILVKDLCERVSDHYDSYWYPHLEEIQAEFIKAINKIQGVHLTSNRIKDKKSLLVKLIEKKYKEGMSVSSKYNKLRPDNYYDIVTDLIGMRMIINYRGKWEEIHDAILSIFPYVIDSEDSLPLAHKASLSFIAEPPIAYYAEGDCISQYVKKNIEASQHPKGYRGLHYIISYKDVYIEVQVRTIYDEAWSECDHRYIYKHEASPSNHALKQLSPILCAFTNIAGDISDLIRDIYEANDLSQGDADSWIARQQTKDSLEIALEKLSATTASLQEFKNRLVCATDNIC